MNASKNNSVSNVTNGLPRDTELNVFQSGQNTVTSKSFDMNGNRDEVVNGNCRGLDTEDGNGSVPTTANLQNSPIGLDGVAQLNPVDNSLVTQSGEAVSQPQRTPPLVGEGSNLRFDDALLLEHRPRKSYRHQ
ncbi:hypothetical protein K435DRAFT_795739 [Dendrothele bispora CBS 962.96]|uniref:Uncharacterized protein n=1 Tax=Dendrothele bispora (strain CBS 962.96) TaxID=1314807 RepID=A0A4S8M7Q4_DENBC|nr:hypothetical protein K435DRAFT_795739 [Dendrothele bispora CBS 962.96]